MSTGFTRLILIAVIIAVPISVLAINRWLESFAYHFEVGCPVYVLGPMAALLVAWLTVSYESLKAAVANPIRSLRTE